jgi:hypothetical protein
MRSVKSAKWEGEETRRRRVYESNDVLRCVPDTFWACWMKPQMRNGFS